MEILSENVYKGLNLDSLTSNPMIYGVLAIFLTVYGPRLSPKLPESVRDLFNNKYFRFTIILLVTYLSSNNLQLALIVSIAFCLIMSYSESQEIQDNFENEVKENFSDFDTIREFHPPEYFEAESEEVGAEGFVTGHSTENLAPVPGATTEPQQLFQDSRNIESESSDPIDAPSNCSGGITNEQCIEFCYGQAGTQNQWCKSKFPQPERSKCRGMSGDNRRTCIQSECKGNGPPGSFCQQTNVNGPSASGPVGAAKIENFDVIEGYLPGDKYMGEWKNDKKHGRGTLTDVAGNVYKGMWVDNKKHGEGTYIAMAAPAPAPPVKDTTTSTATKAALSGVSQSSAATKANANAQEGSRQKESDDGSEATASRKAGKSKDALQNPVTVAVGPDAQMKPEVMQHLQKVAAGKLMKKGVAVQPDEDEDEESSDEIEAFYSDSNGSLRILDRVNRRVMKQINKYRNPLN